MLPFASQYEEPHSFTIYFPLAMRDKPVFPLPLLAPSAQREKQNDPVRRRWRPLPVLPDSCCITALFSKDQQTTQTQSPCTPLIDNVS